MKFIGFFLISRLIANVPVTAFLVRNFCVAPRNPLAAFIAKALAKQPANAMDGPASANPIPNEE